MDAEQVQTGAPAPSGEAPPQDRGGDKHRASYVRLPDGTLAEQLWNPGTKFSGFAIRRPDGTIDVQPTLWDGSTEWVPDLDSLVEKGVVLLPSEPLSYNSEAELLDDIRQYILRCLDISEDYSYLAAGYVLLTWVYDAFDALPYLRALGDYGSGKSRFLQTIGSVCYKPMMASGATTLSPLFRIIERYRGTLVVDEADFGRSDLGADIVKFLNTGYQRGTPLLRSEKQGDTFEPTAFDVYGPKLLATRKRFTDLALESRCLTHVMEPMARRDIPLALDDVFRQQALSLRNRLLSYRMNRLPDLKVPATYRNGLEPRLAQVISPLRTILRDPAAIKVLERFAKSYQARLREDRAQSDEGDVLRALLVAHQSDPKPTIGDIAERLNQHRTERDSLSAKAVGNIVRDTFRLKTKKTGGTYRVEWDDDRIATLRQRYDPPEQSEEQEGHDV